MAQATDARRAVRPPLESVREAPFALVRDTAADGQPNDGLTLDGYGAVFNSITVIDSQEGRFREQNAPGSMKKSFRENPPKMQFDHGRHPMIGSIPIAAVRSISEDVDPVLAPNGGAHVVARLFDNWLTQPLRDAIGAQAIDGMSYRFEVVHEAWTYADGKPIRDERALLVELDRTCFNDVSDEELPLRTLKELKIREIGPVVWPAYAETSVGMRSKVIDLGRLNDPAQRKLLAEAVFIADRAESTQDRGIRDAMQTGVALANRAIQYAGQFAAAGVSGEMRQTEGDDDPAALASALDAILDEAAELIAGVDMITLPPEVAQACALITAAEVSADALLEAMGIYDPDDDEASEPADNTGRSKDVDTPQPTSKSLAGKHLSHHDAPPTTGPEPAGEHPSSPDAPRSTDALSAGKHPSQPRRFTDKQLRVRNQRDRLLNLRTIGERPR